MDQEKCFHQARLNDMPPDTSMSTSRSKPMRFLMAAILALCLLAPLQLLGQTTVTAASCNYTDVNAVINGPTHTAIDGDTIIIPAGTCAWSSQLNITNVGITVKGTGTPNNTPSTFGVGTLSTVINSSISGGIASLFNVTLSSATQTFHLSTINFSTQSSPGSPSPAPPIQIQGTCNSSTCSQVRLDNLNFGSTWNGANLPQGSLVEADSIIGVADHNSINGGHSVPPYFVNVNQGSWLGVGQFGDNSWAAPDTFGGSLNFYIENNVFNAGAASEDDLTGGGRTVCRFNHYLDVATSATSCGGHGTDSTGRPRGLRQVEFYGNTMHCTDTGGCYGPIGFNSGSGFVFQNTWSVGTGSFFNGYISLAAQRLDTSRTWPPWGACSGTDGWDLNSGGVPVACLDQPGRGRGNLISGATPSPVAWPNEALTPIYEWGDSQSGGFTSPVQNGSSTINQNHDFYNENTNQTAQTSASAPFDGTTTIGMGHGTLANRPTSCTAGVGYFATDQGTWNSSGNGFGQGQFYKCTSTNTWTLAYTPYTYPHPLINPGVPSADAPTFSPTPGSYGSAQSVTISTTTSGATICYTSDGSTPTANGAGTCTHGTTYTTPVSVSVTSTLKAIASKSGFSDSTVSGATYTINGAASAPTFSPVAGSYGPTQSVSLSTATTGATICYTTDGSTPTADGAGTCTHGTTYSTAISVASSETIKAIASKSGWNDSSVASAAYVINGPASTPTFSPVAGSYGSAQSVTISSSTAGATLCYTTNGSTPSASSPGVCAVGSTQYTGAVTVSTSLTLKAIATKAGWSSSSVGSAAYVINGAAATPTFSPTSLSSPGWVTISSTTPGASCFYTTDGSAPTTSSTPYTHTLYVAQSQTLKAICSAPTYTTSAVGNQVYSFTTKTRFSLTTTSSSVNPVPFPQDNRACCGSNVAALNPSSGTFDFTVLHNWITQSTANGSTFTYTIQGFPTWMTGLGATESAPPSDLHTSASCAATGTTTTDCSMKSFVIALMKDRTGLSSQPANPTTCSHLDYLEIINEFNTDSPSGSSTGWTGTYSDLATLGNDISTITHAWCSNTVVIAGSASGIVGFHANGENAHYDVALETLLQDWAGISGASLPDAISMHIYPSRQSVVPTPMPTTIVSNSSSSCTSGNTPNTSCYIAVKDEVNQLNSTATLQNTNIVHWAKSLPIYSTEGGFGEVAQLGGTSTTTIGASYVAESMMAIAAQNPINHLFYAANDSTWGCYWNCGSGTSAWLFAFNQMNTWLNGHTITGTLTSTPVTGGNRWSLQLDSGAAELDFCDAWLASCTVSTPFTAQTNLSGVTSATGGSVTLTQEPTLLFNNSAVSTPTFSPVAGTYTSVQSVTISTTTTGATLCYTTDGSTPTANGAGTCTHGTTYTVPVSVATSETLKAVGSKSGSLDSPIGSAAYVINLPAAAATVSGTVVISGSVGIQ